MEFLQINLLVIIIAAILFGVSYLLEKKFRVITKYFKVAPKQFYLILAVLTLIVLVLNYIAISFFGSWQTLILSVIGVSVVGFILLKVYQIKKAQKND